MSELLNGWSHAQRRLDIHPDKLNFTQPCLTFQSISPNQLLKSPSGIEEMQPGNLGNHQRLLGENLFWLRKYRQKENKTKIRRRMVRGGGVPAQKVGKGRLVCSSVQPEKSIRNSPFARVFPTN